MGFLSKVTDTIGDIFNSMTGATQSAKLQNQYQKEFAKNAVQWRAEDLEKAGFNKILAAEGQGATAGGAGGTTGSSGVNPIDTGLSLINTIANAKKLNADSALANAQTLNADIQSQISMIDMMIKSGQSKALIKQAFENVENTIAQTKKIRAEIPVLNANAKQIRENTKLIQGGTAAKTLGTWVNNVATQAAAHITKQNDKNSAFNLGSMLKRFTNQ